MRGTEKSLSDFSRYFGILENKIGKFIGEFTGDSKGNNRGISAGSYKKLQGIVKGITGEYPHQNCNKKVTNT